MVADEFRTSSFEPEKDDAGVRWRGASGRIRAAAASSTEHPLQHCWWHFEPENGHVTRSDTRAGAAPAPCFFRSLPSCLS